MMSVEETFEKGLIVGNENNIKDKDDIDRYAQDNVNTKLPLGGPLFRMYVQPYKPKGSD